MVSEIQKGDWYANGILELETLSEMRTFILNNYKP